jgi:hypothetical protein
MDEDDERSFGRPGGDAVEPNLSAGHDAISKGRFSHHLAQWGSTDRIVGRCVLRQASAAILIASAWVG